MKSDMMYDYMNIIDKAPPPGAEGDNQGNGNASQYFDTSSPKVPVDSKLSNEEEKVLKEATSTTTQKSDKQGSVTITVKDKDANQNPPPKKKDGFFKKLFGGKK
jgi:penicillin-binding protein 1A